MDMVTLVLNWS